MTTYRFLGRRDIADRITRHVTDGQAGQPFLFVGPDGSGKETTALEIARRINCVAPDTCTSEHLCESCLKAVTFQHPDIRWLGPAPASLEDPRNVNQVREIFEQKIANPFHRPGFASSSQVLIGNPEHPGPLTVRGAMQFLRRQSFQGRWKVAVVSDAHRLNTAAANAFLKTLEEPPPASLIFLLSSSTAGLLPTILSRCQKTVFEPYPEAELVGILATLVPDLDPTVGRETARLAAGDARRALALLEPETMALRAWAESVFADLVAGKATPGQLAAEWLHAGILPQGEGDLKSAQTQDTATRRMRALVFCETMQLLLAETIACREQGDVWQPRLRSAETAVRRAAAGRRTETLCDDLARVEQAKHEIDGNLNIGLVMAVLLQELTAHIRGDHAHATA